MISSEHRRKIIREPSPAVGVRFSDERLYVCMEDGREIGAPLSWFPRLLNASAAERQSWEIIGRGFFIHWPDVDEDISAVGMLAGSPARPAKQKA